MNDNTPAASGAAPAEFEPWLRTICITAPPPQAYDLAKQAWAQGMKRGAALASREASSATLTDERIVELWVEHGLDELDPEAFARVIEREVRAALASPQVATAPTINAEPATAQSLLAAMIDIYDDGQNNPPEHRCYVEDAWPEILSDARKLLATPVQVAPQPSAMTTCNCRWDGEIRVQQCELHQAWHDTLFERADQVRGLQAKLAATASVAPQDDARDAAKWRALPAYAERHKVNLVHLFRDIDDAISLSTPAAKPTEEQS